MGAEAQGQAQPDSAHTTFCASVMKLAQLSATDAAQSASLWCAARLPLTPSRVQSYTAAGQVCGVPVAYQVHAEHTQRVCIQRLHSPEALWLGLGRPVTGAQRGTCEPALASERQQAVTWLCMRLSVHVHCLLQHPELRVLLPSLHTQHMLQTGSDRACVAIACASQALLAGHRDCQAAQERRSAPDGQRSSVFIACSSVKRVH